MQHRVDCRVLTDGNCCSDAPAVPEFREFHKIARLSRDVVITEKIDGTNGVVYVGEDGAVLAGSRNRWLNRSLGIDNFGFAKWVEENQADLVNLGPGYHYGEWWGHGIQRGYGLDHKRFSLFNVSRWSVDGSTPNLRPACCDVVPTLYVGPFDSDEVEVQLERLRWGSVAAPGFRNPEGVVIYHTASRTLFKKTIEKDEQPKGQQVAA